MAGLLAPRTGLLAVACVLALSRAGEASSIWHGRSIYFVVTDRFAQDEDDAATSCTGKGWCGGTLKGVLRHLDYIQGMGFDALWITPVVEQVPWLDHWNGTGYHGYWARDFMQIDKHLGTEEDLLELSRACKARNMLFMLDVVANHVGPIDTYDEVARFGPPFNDPDGRHFHQLDKKAGESFRSYLEHPTSAFSSGCFPGNFSCAGYSEEVLQKGWFGDLADLKQENEETRSFLLMWIEHMVKKYELDGLRLDTALYMPTWFLKQFQEAASVYIIGEVTTHNMSFHRSYQEPLQGLLNFPVTMSMAAAFNRSGNFLEWNRLLEEQQEARYPDVHLLGNFVDNHDSDRWIRVVRDDVSLLENALVWVMFHHGVPIVYYGTEQMAVSQAPDNRASMWPHFGRTELYLLLQTLNRLRKDYGLAFGGEFTTDAAVSVAASRDYFAFVRGALLVVVTNVGGVHTATGPKVCFPIASLPPRWGSVCDVSGGGAKEVLGCGDGADFRCEGDQVCVHLDQGRPAVFALSEEIAFV